MSPTAVPVVLVVDTGVDDALALLVAVRHPALELCGVVCTAGNVGLERAWVNTRHVLDLLGVRVPLAAGARRRLDGAEFPARDVHGADGLAGLGSRLACPSGRTAAADEVGLSDHATVTDQVARSLSRAPVPAEIIPPNTLIVSLGPLTSLVGLTSRRVVASYAKPGEANYEMDPPAAKRVSVEAVDVAEHRISPIHGHTQVAHFVNALLEHRAGRGAGLGDAAAMLLVAEPALPPNGWIDRIQTLVSAPQ